jgi:RNA polymerase sigma factor (sigma-70 family)
MTDCQQLLKEYAETGSESAFRELVGRYVNLVYSTALRLVDGDTQLAEDVSQTVYIGLARKAGALSREVMLGGWLYRHTYHVATKAMRRERHRQAREREAVEMNTLQNDPEAIARRVRPILDEALMHLGHEDRQAILLRFFEEQDFRAVGAALHVSEDAARMRVSRAVEKLHAVLTRRGVVLPAAGLSAALGAEAVKAAPAGLAAKLAIDALAGATGGGIMHAAFINIMNATKIKAGLAGVIVAASVITSVVFQQRVAGRVRELDESLRQQSSQAAQLAADHDRLANALAQASASKGQLDELQKLRAETGALRQKTNELAALREEHRRLRQQSQSQLKTPLQFAEQRRARVNFEMEYLRAFRMFENKNDRSPSGFDEAAPFLPAGSDAAANPLRDNFDWVYQLPNTMTTTIFPNSSNLTNFYDILVIRETDPTLGDDGRWTKVYGFADGSTQFVTMPSTWNGVAYNSFEAYENDRIVTPPLK